MHFLCCWCCVAAVLLLLLLLLNVSCPPMFLCGRNTLCSQVYIRMYVRSNEIGTELHKMRSEKMHPIAVQIVLAPTTHLNLINWATVNRNLFATKLLLICLPQFLRNDTRRRRLPIRVHVWTANVKWNSLCLMILRPKSMWNRWVKKRHPPQPIDPYFQIPTTISCFP